VAVEITLSVADNGVGPGEKRNPGNGLNNLRQRAHSLGGDFSFAPGDHQGTVATWTVPRKTLARA
jgi:signal transduction histidine kinase